MLKFFTRMERTRNIILIVFALVLVGSLVLFIAPSQDIPGSLLRSTETAAKVKGERVTVGELATSVERAQQTPYGSIPASMILEGLISSKVIRVEADRLKLTATDQEVATKIRQLFKKDDGTPFDEKNYEAIAIEQAGSVTAFEDSIRDSLSRQNLQAYISSGVTVSEKEVFDEYRRRNSKFGLVYVPVSTADLVATIKPTDEELEKYFEENKKSYYISTPQKKIDYIFLETAKVGEKIPITDEDLKKAYNELPEDRRIEGVKVQEIVLRVSDPSQSNEVLNQANAIKGDLTKNGDVVSEEDFAIAAKGKSENPSTAQKGGQLPGLVSENPNNPDSPYLRVLTMKEGEISEPIQAGSNYYILRRGTAVPKSFEDSKKVLEVSLRNRKAYEVTSELAGKVSDDLKKTKDPRATAEKFADEANSNVDSMVKETGYIKPGDEIEGFGVSQDFEQGIADLKNKGDVGGKIPVPRGFAVPLLEDVKPPREANFDEVKDQVAENYKAGKAREQLEKTANTIAENAESATGISAAASGVGLTAKTADDFILGSPIGEGPSATTSKELEDAIFELGEGEYTKTPIESNGTWYVLGVTSRDEPPVEDFEKEKSKLVTASIDQRKNAVFGDFIASKTNMYKTSGDLKIYKDKLKKVEDQQKDQQEQNPPQIPQMPQQLPPQAVPQQPAEAPNQGEE